MQLNFKDTLQHIDIYNVATSLITHHCYDFQLVVSHASHPSHLVLTDTHVNCS